jgi:hypothetical protein
VALLRTVHGTHDRVDSAEDARLTNVRFADDLLDTEISQRNARKDAQENAARGLIVATGIILTLLLGLARDAGLFIADAPAGARWALFATLLVGGISALCAIGTLWPRKYDRLGAQGLTQFNDSAFLDLPTHEVIGRVIATRIGIAKKMDSLHESKATWLKWSFRFLIVAFVGLVAQGAILVSETPDRRTSEIPPIVIPQMEGRPSD